MEMIKNRIWLTLALLPMALPALAASTWEFDAKHSGAEFKVKHMMISNVTGTIHGVTGKAEYDGKNVKELKVEATMDPTVIDTGEPARDKHLKSADFFDVEKYPTITFKSEKVVSHGGKYELVGDLTMHGVTKKVTLDMDAPTPVIKDPKGREHVGTSAHVTVNRSDFGIYPSDKGVMVSDPVDITIDVDMVKAKETADANEPAKKAG
jgi:polyisoprenoid-binding protein YceI